MYYTIVFTLSMLISSAFYSIPMVKFPALCGKVPKGGNRYLACIISYSAHVFLTHPEQSIQLEQKCTPVTNPPSPGACLVPKSCLTLYNPMDCSPPGPSVHGVS